MTPSQKSQKDRARAEAVLHANRSNVTDSNVNETDTWDDYIKGGQGDVKAQDKIDRVYRRLNPDVKGGAKNVR